MSSPSVTPATVPANRLTGRPVWAWKMPLNSHPFAKCRATGVGDSFEVGNEVVSDGDSLGNIELGYGAVVAIIHRVLLIGGIVGQHAERIGGIIDRLGPGIGDAQAIPIRK